MKVNNLNSIRWSIKTLLSSNLFIFKHIISPLSRHKELFLKKDSDLLIEGYPRSGNTFCAAAFYYFSNHQLSIARHRHEIGHLKHAFSSGVPTLIVFREPIEAISSFILREGVSELFAINFYVKFNSFVLRHNDKLALFEFNDIVNHIENVITRFSSMYNLDLNVSDSLLDKKEIKDIVIQMEKKDSGSEHVRSTHVAYPVMERTALKETIKNGLANRHFAILENANKIYNALIQKKINLFL